MPLQQQQQQQHPTRTFEEKLGKENWWTVLDCVLLLCSRSLISENCVCVCVVYYIQHQHYHHSVPDTACRRSIYHSLRVWHSSFVISVVVVAFRLLLLLLLPKHVKPPPPLFLLILILLLLLLAVAARTARLMDIEPSPSDRFECHPNSLVLSSSNPI